MTTPTPPGTQVSDPSSSLELGRVFGFFFEDANWIPKLLVGSLFAVLSPALVGSVFIAGFAVRLAHRARRGERPALPEWNDLAGIFVDGLKALAIYFGHVLPVAIVLAVLALALGGGSVLIDRTEAIPDALQAFVLLALAGGAFVLFLAFLAVVVYVPAAFARFIQTERLGAAFEIQENVGFIRENVSEYAMGLLAILLAGIIAQLGLFVFCIGVFPASFWSTCAMGFVVGELCRLHEQRNLSK